MNNLLNSNNKFKIDSRLIEKGDTFVAIKAERDGNDFAKDALEKGASKLILNREPNFEIEKERYIIVEDSIKYIAELAKQRFEILKQSGIKTIGLTGSSGKTTTKDFIFYLLSKIGKKVYASPSSFNNHIGFPITILNTPLDAEFLILEVGMNHKGEIAELMKIASPDIKIIINIGKAHIGNFANGIEGIAEAKMEILNESNAETKFITTQSLPFLQNALSKFKGQTFYISEPKNVKVLNLKTTFMVATKEYSINKIVTQNWLNAICFGLKILEVLQINDVPDFKDFAPQEGRGKEVEIVPNCTLIDESYNANPNSTLNAIETLAFFEGKKLLVLGEMKELGDASIQSHAEIIEKAMQLQNTEIFFIGKEFESANTNIQSTTQTSFFPNVESLLETFPPENITDYNYIMVKSSKSTFTSKFVDKILKFYAKQ